MDKSPMPFDSAGPLMPGSQSIEDIHAVWKKLTAQQPGSAKSTYRPPIEVFNSRSKELNVTRLNHSQSTAVCNEPVAYECEEEIGRGGMGIVYKARQLSLDRSVAVKKVYKQGLNDQESQSTFLSEAYTTALLDHPNIVPVYDLSQTDKSDMELAMKIVSGQSWNEIIGELSLVENIQILIKICDGLRYAHSRNIVHLDIKPSNIMIGAYGEVYIMDWGLALSFGPEQKTNSLIRHRSQLVDPCGTPCYSAPELVEGRGEEVGPWTDVYLIGAVLHEIIAGKPPHNGRTLLEVIIAASKSAVPKLGDSAPEELAKLCQDSLNRDPNRRPLTVADTQRRLVTYLEHRKSEVIAKRSTELSLQCEEKAKYGANLPAGEQSQLYVDYPDVIAGFEQAIMEWPENPLALLELQKARLNYAKNALAVNDIGLAETQLTQMTDGEEKRQLLEKINSIRAYDWRVALHQTITRILTFLALGSALIAGTATAINEFQLNISAQEQIEIAISERAAAEKSDKELRLLQAQAELLLGAADQSLQFLLINVDDELNKYPPSYILTLRENLVKQSAKAVNVLSPETQILYLQKQRIITARKLSEIALRRGDLDSALRFSMESLKLSKNWVLAAPDNLERQAFLATAFEGNATVHQALGEKRESRDAILESLKIRRSIAAKPNSKRIDLLNLANALNQSADLWKLSTKLIFLEEAIKIVETLAAEEDNKVTTLILVELLSKHGQAQSLNRNRSRALIQFKRLNFLRKHPMIKISDIDFPLERMAQFYRSVGRIDEALSIYEQLLKARNQKYTENNRSYQDQFRYYTLLRNKGVLQREQGNLKEALKTVSLALVKFKALNKQFPKNSRTKIAVIRSRIAYGETLFRVNEIENARTEVLEARKFIATLTSANRSEAPVVLLLLKTYQLEEKYFETTSQLQFARESYKQRRDVVNSAFLANSQNPIYIDKLVKCFTRILEAEWADRKSLVDSYEILNTTKELFILRCSSLRSFGSDLFQVELILSQFECRLFDGTTATESATIEEQAKLAAKKYWKRDFSGALEVYRTIDPPNKIYSLQSTLHGLFLARSLGELSKGDPELQSQCLSHLELYLKNLRQRRHQSTQYVVNDFLPNDSAFGTIKDNEKFRALLSLDRQ